MAEKQSVNRETSSIGGDKAMADELAANLALQCRLKTIEERI
jgi:hypothetical protein